MRTANFRDDVLFGVADLLGIDPDLDLLKDRAASFVRAINDATLEAWEFWEWSQLLITEERAYRPIWNAGKTFRIGNEVFYLPTLTYFKVSATAPGDPPAGTLPTNTAYYEALTMSDPYIALDQPCRRAIGQIYGVFSGNPLSAPCIGIPFRPAGRANVEAITLHGSPMGLTAFVSFKILPSKFTARAYEFDRAYNRNELVYWNGDGECYRAVDAVPAGNDPTNPYSWVKVPMPLFLAEPVKYAAAGSLADDVNMMAGYLGKAEDLLTRQADRLLEQGQQFRYKGRYGKCCGYWSFAPYPYVLNGAPVTTLTDTCEDEGGYMVTANARDGVTAIIPGQDYVDVVYDEPVTNPNVDIYQLVVVNNTDLTFKIYGTTIAQQSINGFRLWLNAAPPAASNYVLRWSVK